MEGDSVVVKWRFAFARSKVIKATDFFRKFHVLIKETL